MSADFELLDETLVFDAPSTQCVSFQTSEDDIVEGDDTLHITTISTGVNVLTGFIPVTILDDDSKLLPFLVSGCTPTPPPPPPPHAPMKLL